MTTKRYIVIETITESFELDVPAELEGDELDVPAELEGDELNEYISNEREQGDHERRFDAVVDVDWWEK